MDKVVAGIVVGIGAAVGIFGLLVVELLWQVWFLKDVYAWFLLPLGAPALSVWHMGGILILFSMLKTHKAYENHTADIGKSISMTFLGPVLAWLFGMFVHHMMIGG